MKLNITNLTQTEETIEVDIQPNISGVTIGGGTEVTLGFIPNGYIGTIYYTLSSSYTGTGSKEASISVDGVKIAAISGTNDNNMITSSIAKVRGPAEITMVSADNNVIVAATVFIELGTINLSLNGSSSSAVGRN